MGEKKRRARWWLLGAGIGLAALIVIGVVAGPGLAELAASKAEGEAAPEPAKTTAAPAPEKPAVAVTVEQVAVRPIQRTVRAIGSFTGFDEVTVMAEVSGRVVEVCHDVGDVVRPGDVLLRIDPTDFELLRQETMRALELEATRVGLPIPAEKDFEPVKILAVLRQFDVTRLPPVLRAVEQEENARKKFDRSKQLRDQGTITQEGFEQVETDYRVARNTREQADLDARAVVAGIKHRLVLLQIAEKKLRDTNVVVPKPTARKGIPANVEYSVAQRKVTEGEMVKDSPGASTAAFELVMDTVLKYLGKVPERYLGEVKAGQKVEFREIEAYPNRVFEGTITRVSPVVDRTSQTFEIEVLVSNSTRELKPGGFGKGEILTRVDARALTVPLSSIVSFAGSIKVYVLRDGKAQAVLVTPGVEGRGWVELVKPDPKLLDSKSLVITSGHNQLADGVPATVRQPEAPAGAKGKTAQK
jgi:multidrug efflux pump subunit AcrA (membrane-fusion protein)